MKLKNLFLAFVCLCSTSLFVACSDDDDNRRDEGSTVALPSQRAFILNQGSMGLNNAILSFYAPNNDADNIADIYGKQNEGTKLGDTGQDMISYNDNTYIVMYASKYILRLNAAGVEQVRHSFASSDGSPRYAVGYNGKIYVSLYGGVVVKLNAETLQEEGRIQTKGNNLEQMAICNGNLYVTNSWAKLDGDYIYYTDVFVIDLKSFVLKETLAVAENPNLITTNGNKIFLISFGNYSSVPYSVQMIDPAQKNKVSALGEATNMAMSADGNTLYLVNSVTDWSTYKTENTFFSYDVKSGALNKKSFLVNAPSELASANLYMMSVNPFNGDIYVGTTQYKSGNGSIYRFKKDGSFVKSMSSEGQNPHKMVFYN